ncbi:hypothetical protein SAMN05216386_2459 [Nitrosospira briensis]|uniref:Uncharacterized protein n=1 Tax=Nitrosospira briensis TaxID=35799 RepID=A0A1I5DZ85_9PROT|nr:hypothetical protein [Nitrosospira briensis]SFO04151.1 hypothetical protein SAMN05216386_2459 [Nitrosospira briensis]
MKKETKTLKAFSIEEIENAIAKAVSALIDTDVKANVTLFKQSDFDPLRYVNDGEEFELSLTLKVARLYAPEGKL